MDKSTHFIGQPILGQLLNFLDREKIVKISRENGGEKYVKKFNAWWHLTVMLYAVIMRFDSLREITSATMMECRKLGHLGIKDLPRRSTLADANIRRPEQVFGKIYASLYYQYKDKLSSDSRCGNTPRWLKKLKIIGTHHHHYMPLAWTVSMRKGDWGAEYYQCIPHKQLNGSFINSAENTQNLIVYYQKKQLMIGLVCIFPFAAAKYDNSILDNNVIDMHYHNSVTSQKRTFCITLSYNLFSGKQNNDEKKLNNKDNDQGFF